MRSIGEFFERIRSIRTKDAYLRTVVKDALKQVAVIEVPIEKIGISSVTAIINGLNQAERTAVFIKKPSILKEINSRQAVRIFTEIR